jgi:hypothetical protein
MQVNIKKLTPEPDSQNPNVYELQFGTIKENFKTITELVFYLNKIRENYNSPIVNVIDEQRIKGITFTLTSNKIFSKNLSYFQILINNFCIQTMIEENEETLLLAMMNFEHIKSTYDYEDEISIDVNFKNPI